MDGPFPFDTFWSWLTMHPNCVVRAGSDDLVLYDDEDFHWHFATEDATTLLVQVMRGKRLVGELFIEPERVAYVEGNAGEQGDEYTFDLIAESEDQRSVQYFFVLTHGFERDADEGHTRIH